MAESMSACSLNSRTLESLNYRQQRNKYDSRNYVLKIPKLKQSGRVNYLIINYEC